MLLLVSIIYNSIQSFALLKRLGHFITWKGCQPLILVKCTVSTLNLTALLSAFIRFPCLRKSFECPLIIKKENLFWSKPFLAHCLSWNNFNNVSITKRSLRGLVIAQCIVSHLSEAQSTSHTRGKTHFVSQWWTSHDVFNQLDRKMRFSFGIPTLQNGKPPNLNEDLPTHRLFKTIVTSPQQTPFLQKHSQKH